MRNKIISITSFSLVIIGFISILAIPNRAISDFDKIRPTLFVHGYKGTENSFGFMLERFEHEYKWGDKALVYYVTKQGVVQKYHPRLGKEKPMFVQVIFAQNRASFELTASWLANVLQDMKKVYGVDDVNIVGHSMGGIVALKYIKQFRGEQFPSVHKFVTLGSPFDGIYSEAYFQIHHDPAATDLRPDSPALKFLRERPFPKHTQVLSISSTGDAIAVPESVRSLREIVPSGQLTEKVIENKQLGHSDLHESRRVDQLIYEFLWKNQVNMESKAP
ncbi:alpha/beta fold hydrolase [Virgibacillus proomii]|uniref:alpha/beta fold hydrolase n=1 Tax=Virgibacillus proomii TaxID=84407 RepID=UPI00117C0CAA|nr:alpha/beta fold hydrolase [Virgibacillus proomii]